MKVLESIKDGLGNISSMRISLYWVVGMAVAFCLAICSAIIVQATKGDPIEWLGVAAAIAAVGAFMAPALAAKYYQKKIEVSDGSKS